MSRLIDADELKERFCEENCGNNRCVDHMDKCVWICSVEESKTVFDVDEVVQQLEKLIEDKTSESGDDWYTAECLNEAVDIVKGGGVE